MHRWRSKDSRWQKTCSLFCLFCFKPFRNRRASAQPARSFRPLWLQLVFYISCAHYSVCPVYRAVCDVVVSAVTQPRDTVIWVSISLDLFQESRQYSWLCIFANNTVSCNCIARCKTCRYTNIIWMINLSYGQGYCYKISCWAKHHSAKFALVLGGCLSTLYRTM